MERILDDRGCDPAARQHRIAGRLETAHDPGMAAAPDEQPDRPPGATHRAGCDQHRLIEGIRADDLVRTCALQGKPGRPTHDAGALAHAAVEPRRTPLPGEL